MLPPSHDIVGDPSVRVDFVYVIMEVKWLVWDGRRLRVQLAEKTKKIIKSLVD